MVSPVDLVGFVWLGQSGLIGLVFKVWFRRFRLIGFDLVKTVRNSIRLVELARLNQSGYVKFFSLN